MKDHSDDQHHHHNVEVETLMEPADEDHHHHHKKQHHGRKEKRKSHEVEEQDHSNGQQAICSFPHGERPVLPQLFTLVAVICSINAFPLKRFLYPSDLELQPYEEDEFLCVGIASRATCVELAFSGGAYYDLLDDNSWINGLFAGTFFAIVATLCGVVALALVMTAMCLPISTTRAGSIVILLVVSGLSQILTLVAGAIDLCDALGIDDSSCPAKDIYLKRGALFSLFAFFAYVVAAIASFLYYCSLHSEPIEITRNIGNTSSGVGCFIYPHGDRPILPQLLTLMACFCSINAWMAADFGCFEYNLPGYGGFSVECFPLWLVSHEYMSDLGEGRTPLLRAGATFGALAATLGTLALALLFTASCLAIKARRAIVALVFLLVSSFFEMLTFIVRSADWNENYDTTFHLAQGGVFAIFGVLLYIAAAVATGLYYNIIKAEFPDPSNPTRTIVPDQARHNKDDDSGA